MAQHKVPTDLLVFANFKHSLVLDNHRRNRGNQQPLSTMLLLKPHVFTTLGAFAHLASSAPANTTSSIGATSTDDPTKSLLLSISPIHLIADECPTPPTQFLPYPPPPGYVPGPGCPPASSGTQPSEFNPPPGVYGGSGSGSGSSAETSSPGSSLREWNPFAMIFGGVLPSRKPSRRIGASRFSEEKLDARSGWLWRSHAISMGLWEKILIK